MDQQIFSKLFSDGLVKSGLAPLNLAMRFCDKLKDARKTKGLSQETLADTLAISQGVISAYERGKHLPSLESAIEIARPLEVGLDWLTDESRNESAAEHRAYLQAVRDVGGYAEARLRIVNSTRPYTLEIVDRRPLATQADREHTITDPPKSPAR